MALNDIEHIGDEPGIQESYLHIRDLATWNDGIVEGRDVTHWPVPIWMGMLRLESGEDSGSLVRDDAMREQVPNVLCLNTTPMARPMARPIWMGMLRLESGEDSGSLARDDAMREQVPNVLCLNTTPMARPVFVKMIVVGA